MTHCRQIRYDNLRHYFSFQFLNNPYTCVLHPETARMWQRDQWRSYEVRRVRCTVGVEGWGVVEGIALPRQKINLLCLQNDKFGWTLTQFLTGSKHGRSLKALVHGFYGSIVKRSLRKSAKLSKYSQSDQKGRRLHHRWHRPPEYATKETILQVGILQGRHFMDEINESI